MIFLSNQLTNLLIKIIWFDFLFINYFSDLWVILRGAMILHRKNIFSSFLFQFLKLILLKKKQKGNNLEELKRKVAIL